MRQFPAFIKNAFHFFFDMKEKIHLLCNVFEKLSELILKLNDIKGNEYLI